MNNYDQKDIEFVAKIHSFYAQNKRHFPWRKTTNPYKIVVSEVMLQQTQTNRVIPKYLSFIKKIPNFSSLSKASTADVLKVWQGLGYNRRALNLKRLSEVIMDQYKGSLPNDPTLLIGLPGIGKATAGSISAFAFNKPVLFIETNIRRVFIHEYFSNQEHIDDKDIFPLIEKTLDQTNPREWYYALMDY